MFILISLKTEIARSVKGPKLQGPHAEDAMAKPYLEICSRGAGSSHSMDTPGSVQKQNFTRNPEKLAKVPWDPRGSQKSFTLTIPWNSEKLVKISP